MLELLGVPVRSELARCGGLAKSAGADRRFGTAPETGAVEVVAVGAAVPVSGFDLMVFPRRSAPGSLTGGSAALFLPVPVKARLRDGAGPVGRAPPAARSSSARVVIAPCSRAMTADRSSAIDLVRRCIDRIVWSIVAISASNDRPQLGHPDDVSAVAPQFEHGYDPKACPPTGL